MADSERDTMKSEEISMDALTQDLKSLALAEGADLIGVPRWTDFRRLPE